MVNLKYKEILEAIITELAEKALSEFRETNVVSKEIAEASNRLNLTPEIEDYIGKIYSYSAEEKEFLYLRGAKDCVVLLKGSRNYPLTLFVVFPCIGRTNYSLCS